MIGFVEKNVNKIHATEAKILKFSQKFKSDNI